MHSYKWVNEKSFTKEKVVLILAFYTRMKRHQSLSLNNTIRREGDERNRLITSVSPVNNLTDVLQQNYASDWIQSTFCRHPSLSPSALDRCQCAGHKDVVTSVILKVNSVWNETVMSLVYLHLWLDSLTATPKVQPWKANSLLLLRIYYPSSTLHRVHSKCCMRLKSLCVTDESAFEAFFNQRDSKRMMHHV